MLFRLLRFVLPAALLIAVGAHSEVVPDEFIVRYRSSAAGLFVAASRHGARVTRDLPLIRAKVIRTTRSADQTQALLKELVASGEVEYVEPNYVYHTQALPDDPRFAEQWALENTGQTGGTADIDIDAPAAWDLPSGEEVVVGVVDTGVNYRHPDLQENLWRNPGEVPQNGLDDDGNGVVDDVHGYNALTGTGDPLDDNGHGSHVAGIIGASGNNALGVSGVNWRAKIMALKFLSARGMGTTDDAVDAIRYALRLRRAGVNLRVLSNSWGGTGSSRALEDAIEAAEAEGILFVAAAGNSALDNDVLPLFPSSFRIPNVVSVGAVDANGNLASFSNYGAASVDIAAPGVGILSTVLNSNYSLASGTSMATPFVSGVAALVLSREPSLSGAELKTRLLSTVKPLSTLQGLIVSRGIVDAHNALTNTVRVPLLPYERTIYSVQAAPIHFQSDLGTKILTADDGYAEVALHYYFPYYRRFFSRLAVSSNGRIIPLDADERLPTGTDWLNRLSEGINVLYDDYYPAKGADGGVWLKSDEGTTTITWVVTPYAYRNSASPDVALRFQARLYESGRIEFHYADTVTGDAAYDYGATATVGIAPTMSTVGTRLLVSHNSANPAQLAPQLALRFQLQANFHYGDFDGDTRSDLVVFHPPGGVWTILTSSSNFSEQRTYQLGGRGDTPLIGDFDGDALSDIAVWQKQRQTWRFKLSASGFTATSVLKWGKKKDQPLLGDFDSDGRSDLVLYRGGKKAKFYSLASSRNYSLRSKKRVKATTVVTVDGRETNPIVADFTGEGRDDLATLRRGSQEWTIRSIRGQLLRSGSWGTKGGTALACDIDHSGAADRIVVSPDGAWLKWEILTDRGAAVTVPFGTATSQALCRGDFDGDAIEDLRTFENGIWTLHNSATGEARTIMLGQPGDIGL